MHTDAATLIGRLHLRSAEPSEDYACSGQVGEQLAYAIVSDGCSGGAETDLGSRLLAVTLARLIERNPAPRQWLDSPAALEDLLVAELDRLDWWELGLSDTTATLVGVVATETECLGVISGDGALVVRYPDGSFDVVEQTNALNAPHYLNYRRSPDVLQRYIASQQLEGALNALHLTRVDRLGIVRERTQIASAPPAAQGALRVINLSMFQALDTGEPPAIVLAASDGFNSRRGVEGIATLVELLGFKGLAGKFLRRHLGAAQLRWLRDGSVPQDDLSIAGIHLGAVDTIDSLVSIAIQPKG